MDIPEIIQKINKDRKTIKLTTLDRAKAMNLKRFFSGSFIVDHIIGGGFAYRRIQLLFGSKSSGKNALLNQMIAYNQRICRNCLGVRPDFYTKENDRWSVVLVNILNIPECKCDNPEGKKYVVLDYERSISIETPKTVKVLELTNSQTGEPVDELDWNDAKESLALIKSKEHLEDSDHDSIKNFETFLNNIKVKENIIEQINMKDYLKLCGVLTNELIVGDPRDTEEGIEFVAELIDSKGVDGIIWDSLQSSIPRYVKDRDAGDATMGVEAKQNGLLMRRACSAMAAEDLEDESESYKPPLFITSQVRSNLGGFHAGPDTYSGGNAVQHHISLALEIKRQKFLKQDGGEAKFEDSFYGQSIRLRADKNKLNAPGEMLEYKYFFKEGEAYPVGIDHVGEIVTLGIKTGAIERAGAYYRARGENFQGMEKLVNFFRENPKFVGQLYKDIRKNG